MSTPALRTALRLRRAPRPSRAPSSPSPAHPAPAPSSSRSPRASSPSASSAAPAASSSPAGTPTTSRRPCRPPSVAPVEPVAPSTAPPSPLPTAAVQARNVFVPLVEESTEAAAAGDTGARRTGGAPRPPPPPRPPPADGAGVAPARCRCRSRRSPSRSSSSGTSRRRAAPRAAGPDRRAGGRARRHQRRGTIADLLDRRRLHADSSTSRTCRRTTRRPRPGGPQARERGQRRRLRARRRRRGGSPSTSWHPRRGPHVRRERRLRTAYDPGIDFVTFRYVRRVRLPGTALGFSVTPPSPRPPPAEPPHAEHAPRRPHLRVRHPTDRWPSRATATARGVRGV